MTWSGTRVCFAAVVSPWMVCRGEVRLAGRLLYGVGPAPIADGNVAVWTEVLGFGANRTIDAEGRMKVDGPYRFSRNPQEVADITVLIGWALPARPPWRCIRSAPGISS